MSRRVGGAVERNHVKRLLREAFARAEGELAGGQDLVIVARSDVREVAERDRSQSAAYNILMCPTGWAVREARASRCANCWGCGGRTSPA